MTLMTTVVTGLSEKLLDCRAHSSKNVSAELSIHSFWLLKKILIL
jgi:hypothetical protein